MKPTLHSTTHQIRAYLVLEDVSILRVHRLAFRTYLNLFANNFTIIAEVYSQAALQKELMETNKSLWHKFFLEYL